MKLKTIIVEDEKPAARRLNRMLEKMGITPLAMLHSVSESVEWLRNNPNPDIIFLDIQLSDGLSFEIFETVKVESAIIFTTAYDEYALKAFKLNSVDYLLKPTDVDELIEAINKYKKQKSANTQTLDYSTIQSLFQRTTKTSKDRFITQIGQHLKIIQTKDIECFYSEDKASYASLITGKIYPIDGSIESIFKELNAAHFFRVNRRFIVSMSAIKDIISYTNSRLKIVLNEYRAQEIIVSREKVREFKNWLT